MIFAFLGGGGMGERVKAFRWLDVYSVHLHCERFWGISICGCDVMIAWIWLLHSCY